MLLTNFKSQNRREEAETCALQALTYILEEESLYSRFLGYSGLAVDDLKVALSQPETLASILDFLLTEEAALVDFCERQEIPARTIWELRCLLPGAPQEVYISS